MDFWQELRSELKFVKNSLIAVSTLLVVLYFVSPFIVSVCVQPVINFAEEYQDLLLHIAIFVGPFAYLKYRKPKSKSAAVDGLGLNRSGFTPKNIGIGIVAYVATMVILIAVLLVWALVFLVQNGIQPPQPAGVIGLFKNAPFWYLLVIAVFAPISEEVFFRGFLVPRIGIFWSSMLFASLHAGYCSWAELLATFVFGLVAGYVLKKTKSLYPSITAHILLNTINLILAVSL